MNAPVVRGLVFRNARRGEGFSLVELMIAMVLGLLVAEGIYILFAAAGRVNTTQTALARLQENGRVAIELIADDLRSAGRMACGSSSNPLVFADSLADHIVGQPVEARVPAAQPDGTPYALDRSVFLGGTTCVAKSCSPALSGVPRAGLGAGDRIPGADVLIVRRLDGDGVPAAGAGQVCADGKVTSLDVHGSGSKTVLDGFKASHLALLASCTQAQVFKVELQGNSVLPASGRLGVPTCSATDAQTRLFDLDAQLQTSVYYLQLAADDKRAGRKIATLMRSINGVAGEVVQGVERLDLRYSLTDAAGNAHWLNADELGRGVAANGQPLQCGQSAALRPCAWKDVDAVEIALLVNTVDDLPAESAADAWDYRYSIDAAGVLRPAATMPATGLPPGRMLRREFRTVVALRGMTA